MAQPKAGEFVIYRDRSGQFSLGEVAKVTVATTIVDTRFCGTRHLITENILFSGPEDATKALAERLKSSAALRSQEITAADQRHNARVANLIAKADADNLSASASQTADDASGMNNNPTGTDQ